MSSSEQAKDINLFSVLLTLEDLVKDYKESKQRDPLIDAYLVECKGDCSRCFVSEVEQAISMIEQSQALQRIFNLPYITATYSLIKKGKLGLVYTH